MLKRTNKITSLLVAAAAIVSIVPASAADVKKVESQDGVIYNAVAYKNGTALVDGEVKDNDAAYFLKDGKYTNIADVDSGSDYTVYGSKYVNADDGDYFIDLETGKSTDDDIAEDNEDDAASALRKKVKDSDRYGDTTTGTGISIGYADDTIAGLTVLPGAKFGETWYAAQYAVDASNDNVNGVALGYYNVYTDVKGNYIDADYNLGKIKVETTSTAVTTTSASVTIENTKDTYKLRTSDDTFAKIIATKVLGQDKDNIYRYAKIEVTTLADKDGNVLINGKSFQASSNIVTLNVIQKISKAQDSDDIDDAKYAKTVTNYVISDEKGVPDTSYLNFVTDPTTEARVIGGKLAIFKVVNTSSADNVFVQASTLKSKNGFYYTDIEDDISIQAEYDDDLDRVAVDTDVNGNIYVIESGYVKKFDGTDDFTKVYKVDGSMNAISAYDKDNMVVWSQDDEVYSVINGKKVDDTKVDPVTPVVTIGWVQATDGTWSYNKADGAKVIGWVQDGSNWYYTNTAGVMQYGWQNIGGTWYYLNPISDGTKGLMKTGWQNIGGTWYYLNPISDGTRGAMKTGWINVDGTYYYLNSSGAMLANTTVNGYVLGSSGAWIR